MTEVIIPEKHTADPKVNEKNIFLLRLAYMHGANVVSGCARQY